MPVLLKTDPAAARPWAERELLAAADDRVIEIGIVNNMPDGALQATEQQFIALLAKAAGERTLRLHFFAMPGVPRGPAAAAHIGAHYAAFAGMGEVPLDGLVVTGCEPRTASLADEPFWDSFTRLVDWAENNTATTLWSCLAAHAAVLHLDGVARRRLPAKRAGLFDSAAVTPHALLAGLDGPMRVPHSRWNDLHEGDLATHGYSVLTRSAEAGVDLFVKPWRSLFVFFQGHPEYDVDSLAREYRRDAARFLRGERPDYPGLPHGYFDPATEAALEAVRVLAVADRTKVGLRDFPRRLALRDGVAETWQQTSLPVFRNWVALMG